MALRESLVSVDTWRHHDENRQAAEAEKIALDASIRALRSDQTRLARIQITLPAIARWKKAKEGSVALTEEREQQTETSAAVTSQLDVSQVTVVALSSDRELIQASCQIRLRVDMENAQSFLALLRGKHALATWDLAALLRDELFAKLGEGGGDI